MGLTKKAIRELKEALPIGSVIVVLIRNGSKVNSYVNDRGFEISMHTQNEIMFYSPHTMKHHGAIQFDHFDMCSISKTHVRLDDCSIAIKKKGELK